MRTADGWRALRRGLALGLVAGLVSVAVSACGSLSVKPTAATASVVSAPVRIAHTRLGAVGYRVVGSGPPLVLIMGYGCTMEGWDPRLVHALARYNRVVMFDNSGVGRTPASAGTKEAQSIAEADWWAGTDAAGRKIAGISVPALIADGVSDQLAPVANDHILARLIPGARLVLYPDAGHGFLFQEGTSFASLVESFLTGHPSSS